MNQLTRRELFVSTARTLAAGAMAQAIGKTAMAIPPIGRTRPSHLKLSVAAYSYRDYLTGKRDPKLNLFEFVDLAADMALDGVEPTSYYFPPDVNADYLNRLKLHAFSLGLDISGTAIRNDFCVPPGDKRELQVRQVQEWIDRAAELSAPVIRIFGGTVPKGVSDEVAASWVVDGISAVLPHAVKKGIVLALENHGGITSSPEQMLRLVKAIDSPNFGVNLDTGNFHGPDPYAEIAQLAPYAMNVQVKTEIKRSTARTKEPADLSRLIGILREARYSGYVVLEYEAAEDPMQAIPGHIKALRQLIS